MQALFKDTKSLQKLLRVVSTTNTLVNFITTPMGISIQAMSDSKTTLLQVSVGMSFFSHYKSDKNYMLGIRAPTLETLVKTAKAEEMVGFSYADGGDILTVRIGSPGGGETTEYQIRLINIEEDQLDVPQMDYDVVVDIPSAVFHGWKSKTALTNGPVSFAFEPSAVKISAVSDEWGTVQLTNPVEYSIHRSNQSCTINSNSMNALNILATCSNVLRFGLVENMPLNAVVQIDDSTQIKYFIAPMMTED
jgi:proliferating cell nuclear antigen